jgi:hypothetical protein
MTETRARTLLTLAVAPAAFLLYALTSGDTVHWQDSGIFLAAVHDLGIPFEPGFPLYVLLAKLTSLLLPFMGFARAVTTFSNLAGAAAATVCALTAYGLTRRRHGPVTSWVGALAVGWWMAVGVSFWAQAVNAEVYALHALLWSLSLWGVTGPWRRPLKDGFKYPAPSYKVGAFFAGLALANHPSAILLLPVLVALAQDLVEKTKETGRQDLRRAVWVGAGLYVAAAVVPYAALPLMALGSPGLVMGDMGSVGGVLRHVTARTFTSAESAWGFDSARIIPFLQEIWWQYRVGLLVFGLGMVVAWKKDWSLMKRGLLAALPVVIVNFVYLQGGEWDTWLVPAYLSLAPLMALGVTLVVERLVAWKVPLVLASVAVVALVVLPPAVANHPYVDRRGDHDARDFGMNHLRVLPKDAVLLARGDPVCSTLAYLQVVEGVRPDVAVVWVPLLSHPWYRDWAARRLPDLTFPSSRLVMPVEEAVQAFAVDNVGRRRVFLSQMMPNLPRPPRFLAQVPAGSLVELTRDPPVELDRASWDYQYTDPAWFTRPARPQVERAWTDNRGRHTVRVPYRQDMVMFEVRGWLAWSSHQMRLGRPDQALEGYPRILALDPGFNDPGALHLFGAAFHQTGSLLQARDVLERSVQAHPDWAPTHVTLSQVCTALEDQACAFQALKKAQELDPTILQRMQPAQREREAHGHGHQDGAHDRGTP